MVSELKQRNRNIKEKKIMNKDEVYHGALEDILLGMIPFPPLLTRDNNHFYLAENSTLIFALKLLIFFSRPTYYYQS